MIKKSCFTNLNFTQVCRDCKSYYKTFKVDINKYYDKNGRSKVKTEVLYEKFSFICLKCGLLNILSFDKLCNEETVLFLREKDKKN